MNGKRKTANAITHFLPLTGGVPKGRGWIETEKGERKTEKCEQSTPSALRARPPVSGGQCKRKTEICE